MGLRFTEKEEVPLFMVDPQPSPKVTRKVIMAQPESVW